MPEGIEGWKDFVRRANAVAEKCAAAGMKFTYHNHSHEFIRLENGQTPFEILVEGLNPKTTSFVLDTYWVQHGGGDVRWWIEQLKGRIDILHLKDMMRLEHSMRSAAISMRRSWAMEISTGPAFWNRRKRAALNIILSSRTIVLAIPLRAWPRARHISNSL